MSILSTELEKAIHKSQHCQRNWDLSKSIPEQDLQTLITAVTQCPSKQNLAFYKAHFITNRALIEKMHDMTDGFTVKYEPLETVTNSQIMANLVVVFEGVEPVAPDRSRPERNEQIREFAKGEGGAQFESVRKTLNRDRDMAIGVAAGYLNLTAALLGYQTGCCACFNPPGIRELLGLECEPALLMGIGFKNDAVGRRVHHTRPELVFPTNPKQPIQVSRVP